MNKNWKAVLHAMYELEEPLINAGDFDSIWNTPAKISEKIPYSEELGLDESAVRAVLDELWIARKIMLFPVEPSEDYQLKDVVLDKSDAWGDGENKLRAEQKDCRFSNGETVPEFEQVAVYPPSVEVKARTRTAEIGRLLSFNYQRFQMQPSTGFLRYERREQRRPLREVPIPEFCSELVQGVREAGKLYLEERNFDWKIDQPVDGATLAQAIEIVLTSLNEFLAPGGTAEFSVFQVEATLNSLAGLYAKNSFGKQQSAQVITAGTGSGKSYAFQIPALVHLAYCRLKEIKGIRVLFLYPRVALAGNQFKDFDELVAKINENLPDGVDIPQSVLDSGGLLKSSMGIDPEAGGSSFSAIKKAYSGEFSLLISNMDTLSWRFAHPEASEGLTKDLDLIVIDEIHLFRGIYGSHCQMALKRLRLMKHVWQKRKENSNLSFSEILNGFKDWDDSSGQPFLVGASATIAQPKKHTATLFSIDPKRVIHVDAKASAGSGWVHHFFLRQKVKTSNMSALINATACLVHNRRNGLFREFYERTDNEPIGLEDLPDPVSSLSIEPRNPNEIHKTLGFSDSLDNIGRWGDTLMDNEVTKEAAFKTGPSARRPQAGSGFPYFNRFFEPLWYLSIHLQDVGSRTEDAWSKKMRRHYGGFCAKCKKGIGCSIKRKPASIDGTNLTASDLEKIDKLWSTDPNESSSYFRKLGFCKSEVEKEETGNEEGRVKKISWALLSIPDVLSSAAEKEEIENLDRCPFSKAGLCWYSSKDHIGTNRPSPAETLNGWKTPARRDLGYHPVSGGRVVPFTSSTKFNAIELNSMDEVFRTNAQKMFKLGGKPRDQEEECTSLVLGSPRLEVGIDLNQVQDGITFRAMTDPASLQQKVGRVGREAGADSLVLHVVTANIRDQFYFRNPTRLLNPEYLQAIPLHAENKIIACHHYFMAIVDFLCLDAGKVANEGDRLALVNDHKHSPQSWGKWEEKVKGANDFLFGASSSGNLDNLKSFLTILGAQEEEVWSGEDVDVLPPESSPGDGQFGAIQVFKHEFGSKFFLTPLDLREDRDYTVAEFAGTRGEIAVNFAEPDPCLTRHNQFVLKELYDPPGKSVISRSNLANLLQRDLFVHGIPRKGIKGDFPFVWASSMFSLVGTRSAAIVELKEGADQSQWHKPLCYESISMVTTQLLPGTVNYRFGASPKKVPTRIGDDSSHPHGISEAGSKKVYIIYLDLSGHHFEKAGCSKIAVEDSPEDVKRELSVVVPVEIPVIASSPTPSVCPASNLLDDDEELERRSRESFQLQTPPKTYALRWLRVESGANSLIPCRFASFATEHGCSDPEDYPKPLALDIFSEISFHEDLHLTEFSWGSERTYASRRVDPVRFVFLSSEGNERLGIGHNYKAPGVEFKLALSEGSKIENFIDQLLANTQSQVYQSLLIQYLHHFLKSVLRDESFFLVNDLVRIILCKLLKGWLNPGDQPPADSPLISIDEIKDSFDPDSPKSLISDSGEFRRICFLLAAMRRTDGDEIFGETEPHLGSIASNIADFNESNFRNCIREILLNTFGLALRKAGMKLTGAEDENLGYFYKIKEGFASIYLFDRDEYGNGTCDLIREQLHISLAERTLNERLRSMMVDIDPLPSFDFAACFEEELNECDNHQAAAMAFHGNDCSSPPLSEIQPLCKGESKSAQGIFDYVRSELGLNDFSCFTLFQACPEYLLEDSEKRAGGPGKGLVGEGQAYLTYESFENSMRFCTSGCIACLDEPEHNLKGGIESSLNVNTLALNAFYAFTLREFQSTTVGKSLYPSCENANGLVDWKDIASLSAQAVGVEPYSAVNNYSMDLKDSQGTSHPVAVTPSCRPLFFHRRLRHDVFGPCESIPMFIVKMGI